MSELDDIVKALGLDDAPRQRSWQQSGTITVGGGQPFTMQADFGEADTYTVGFLPPFANGNDAAVRPTALIMWNVEGSYRSVRCSIVGGMSLTAAAQGVKIIISDDTPSAGKYVPVGTQYAVGCQVARGTRGATTIAPFFIPSSFASPQILTAAQPLLLPIPENSGVQSVLVAVTASALGSIKPPVPGDVTVFQLATSPTPNNPAAQPTLVNAYDPVINPMWWPIAPGCNELKIVAASAGTNTVNCQVMFGVDG